MEYKSVKLNRWIKENTKESKSVVEMGAGFFDRINIVDKKEKEKIGIEIYKPYIDESKCGQCIKIHGDILEYRELLTGYTPETVMIIDVLEHLEYDDGINWISMLKEDFKKILLMLPIGNHPQVQDLTGHEGHEYQTHRTTWTEEMVKVLEFDEDVIDHNFHSSTKEKDSRCYFGIWNKK